MPPSVIPAKAGIQFDDELSGLPWLPRDHADAFYRFIRDRAMRDPQVLCILAQQPEILVKLENSTGVSRSTIRRRVEAYAKTQQEGIGRAKGQNKAPKARKLL